MSLVAACGPTGRLSPEETPAPRPTPADATAIREIDIESLPDVEFLLAQLGSGALVSEEILYHDLTDDLREEAIVPVTSEGTAGNIAYLVLRMESGSPEVILTRTLDRSTRNGLRMTVEGNGLIETAGEYGPSDPLCCPSVLRKTYFRWDGSRLQVERELKEESAAGPKHGE